MHMYNSGNIRMCTKRDRRTCAYHYMLCCAIRQTDGWTATYPSHGPPSCTIPPPSLSPSLSPPSLPPSLYLCFPKYLASYNSNFLSYLLISLCACWPSSLYHLLFRPRACILSFSLGESCIPQSYSYSLEWRKNLRGPDAGQFACWRAIDSSELCQEAKDISVWSERSISWYI